MIRSSFVPAFLFVAAAFAATPVFAEVQTFDPGTITLSNTPAPGAWQTDRYNPAGFSSASFDGGNRLKIDLAATDSLANRPAPYDNTFYNFQGRKFDTNLTGPAQSMSIDLYVGAVESMPINTGLWATGNDGVTVTQYPTIVYRKPGVGSRGIYGWDAVGGYALLQAIADDAPGQWYNIGFQLTVGSGFQYKVNNVDAGLLIADTETTSLGNAIINSYNSGVDHTVYYDNFSATVPEPASLSVLAIGATALLLRRRKN